MIRNDNATNQGISGRCPLIIIITDGLAGDIENCDLVKKMFEDYLGQNTDLVKLFTGRRARANMLVILIPGKMTEAEIQSITKDTKSLSNQIVVILARDCENGMSASFRLLANSVVAGRHRVVGENMTVKFDRKNLGITKQDVTPTGEVDLDDDFWSILIGGANESLLRFFEWRMKILVCYSFLAEKSTAAAEGRMRITVCFGETDKIRQFILWIITSCYLSTIVVKYT